MPASFPHRYEVRLVADGEESVLAAAARPEIRGGAPPEFDGSDRWWSPEDLLLSSLALCFTTTFQAFARRAKLTVLGFAAHAGGVLDKTATGLAFTSFRLRVHVRVDAADRERTRDLLERAKRGCLVANALKTPVDLEVAIGEVAAEESPAAVR